MPDRIARLCVLSGIPFLGTEAVFAAYPEDARSAYARYAAADEAELRGEFRAFCEAMAAKFGSLSGVSSALDAILAQDVAGPAREARLQASNWGFGPSEIRCPVDVWHSEADDMVPYAAARLSFDGLDSATWHVQREASHLASEATLRHMAERLGRPGQ